MFLKFLLCPIKYLVKLAMICLCMMTWKRGQSGVLVICLVQIHLIWPATPATTTGPSTWKTLHLHLLPSSFLISLSSPPSNLSFSSSSRSLVTPHSLFFSFNPSSSCCALRFSALLFSLFVCLLFVSAEAYAAFRHDRKPPCSNRILRVCRLC